MAEEVGHPISRAEALKIAKEILETAEKERTLFAEYEADRGIQLGDYYSNTNKNIKGGKMINFEELKELNNKVGELYEAGIIGISPGRFQLRFELFKSLFLEKYCNDLFSVSMDDYLRIAIVRNGIEYVTLLDVKKEK